MKKNLYPKIILPILGVVILIALFSVFRRKGASDIPTAPVKYGEFLIELTVTGEVQAAKSINISAPRVRINMQIIKLIPEGTVVDSGDFLIQFDTNELQKQIDDKISELEITQANCDKSKASLEANMAQMVSSLESTRASYELAQLRLSQMEYEADVKVQEEKLRLRQAEIELQQAVTKIEAQKIIDAAELKTLELKIKLAQGELDKAREQMEQMTLTSPASGLVVYHKTWEGGNMEKIKVGHTPWRGQALIQLPDLSKLQVISEVSEADIGLIRNGQSTAITLDAFPDYKFTGTIFDIASLAHEKDGENDIKVFDILIDIEGTDPVLKPGITAKAKILLEKHENVYYVPIESVFEDEDEHIVYVIDGSIRKVLVKIGKRNDNHVIIEGEIAEGGRVALVDPYRKTESEGMKLQDTPEIAGGKSE
ncbi:efflux RND transporter periplasmic adaptor subunit [bacterium]|nr:efflux RND transporter periplasmic adaptor subunit [FCB group bacterium]MBL7191738.1 efflux RND transporter periplasmic adaptor subunit [bacterium]